MGISYEDERPWRLCGSASRENIHDDVPRRDAAATKPQYHNPHTLSRNHNLSPCVMPAAPKRVTRSQSKRKVNVNSRACLCKRTYGTSRLQLLYNPLLLRYSPGNAIPQNHNLRIPMSRRSPLSL